MRNVIILAVVLVNLLFSRNGLLNLKLQFHDYEVTPNKFCVNNTGIYFLDTYNRQISFLGNDNSIKYSGGYGITGDAFIDPIDILSSKLNVWIVDGTENKLIVFDHKLNYLETVEFKDIYPIASAIDDWGNILLYSELEDKIYKIENTTFELNQFIDLNIYNFSGLSPKYLHCAKDGSIGVLYEQSLVIFNRLGQLKKSFPANNDYHFIFKKGFGWFAIDQSNFIINLISSKKDKIAVEKTIMDIHQDDDRLYFLVEDQIYMINVDPE